MLLPAAALCDGAADEPAAPAETPIPSSEDGWWNILLLGSDSRDMTNIKGRTDTMIVLSIRTLTDPDTGELSTDIKLTSIMRDIWVHLPHNSGWNRINAANRTGGPEMAIETVNEYFDLDIQDYLLVNMEVLAFAIDALGGIAMDITEEEMGQINWQLGNDEKEFTLSNPARLEVYGEDVLLTGNQAVAFARIRKLDNDFVRTARQRDVITAIAAKAKALTLAELLVLGNSLIENVATSLDVADLTALATRCLAADMDAIGQFRVPVDGTFWYADFGGASAIDMDFEENTRLLHEFIYGSYEPETEE